MSYVRVKVCGITREEDARAAIRHGADAVGFVLWPDSPRALPLEHAAALSRALPRFVWKVGVFVNASPDEVEYAAAMARLDAAQLHGDEDASRYTHLAVRIIKGIGVTGPDDVARALALPPDVMPLVDAKDETRRGGTGQQASWRHAAEIARVRPIILAGGVSKHNVADAVETVRPWGVDLSSSLETEPGLKSAREIAEFFAAIEPVRSLPRE
jgi:phosphoribosylanthranilate isomerase